MQRIVFFCTIFFFGASLTCAQGQLSGRLESYGNFFMRDSLIGAANTPQYDHQLYGAEAWLDVNYRRESFEFRVRFDLFNNSNLLNPQDSYTAQGLGLWYVSKELNKLKVEAGYLYDQIGSGIIYRAYEERALAIDQALLGLRLQYQLADNWTIRAFTGRQKQQFDAYRSIIKGLAIDGALTLGKEKKVYWLPGLGIVNRTLDDATMQSLVANLATYLPEDQFVPVYNAYAFTLYQQLVSGPFNWYLETAYKTKDNMNDPFGVRATQSGDTITGPKFIQAPGTVLYSSLSFAKNKFGASLEVKRTQNFSFRTRPQETLNRGLINFLPPMTRINTYRLTARYAAATQEFGEMAYQADLSYAFSKKARLALNFSNITDLKGQLLYRELYSELTLKKKRKWTLIGGVQWLNYNQAVYFFKPDAPLLEAVTPYADFLYKISRKKSIRFEGQYMKVGKDEQGELHDYGDWLFGLVEFAIAPHWTFTVSDMYNIRPGHNSPVDEQGNKLSIHYPRFDVYYSYGPSRFSLSYVKQVEGIICSGGICRVEPAFSGVKLSVSSSF